MLTYHFIPLSNPVNPEMLHHTDIQCFAYEETPSCGQCMDRNPRSSSPFQVISFCKVSANARNCKIKWQDFACVWKTFPFHPILFPNNMLYYFIRCPNLRFPNSHQKWVNQLFLEYQFLLVDVDPFQLLV